MRVRLESLGCRLNIGEMEELARTFAAGGHRVVGPGDETDLVVFNTCAVTRMASRKSRKLLRQLRRRHPSARLVATGCYAELSPDRVREIGVDLVVSNRHKDELPVRLERAGLLDPGDPVRAPASSPFPGPSAGRTRAFVKVQDGCDNRCTFCIVTVARGKSRSRRPGDVVREVARLAEAGFREVVLSGVHLGAWGHDLSPTRRLAELLDRLLADTHIERIRLSSLEPWDLDASLFDRWADPRLLPHLHLPLQSGSDRILERMARRTTRRDFAALVSAARERIADLSVTTDIIVGFPGEEDADFEQTLEFVNEMAFAGIHVFRYSRRAGTAAARMPGAVSDAVIRARSARLHSLAAERAAGFRAGLLGRTAPVLWETAEPWGDGLRWTGLTANYVRVVTETTADIDLRNQVVDAHLVGQEPAALVGVTPHAPASTSLHPEPHAGMFEIPAPRSSTGRTP